MELFGFIEVHKTFSEFDYVNSKFKRYGREVVLNGAQLIGRSEDGTHGGELASATSDIVFVKFKETVINQIQSETGDTVHFSGGILRMKNVSVLFIFAYLKCSVGMNDENQRRMEQISLLIKIHGLPWILYADFNMLPEELSKSGWPQFLKAEIVIPTGATSTLKNVSGRIIDYLMVHRSIFGAY